MARHLTFDTGSLTEPGAHQFSQTRCQEDWRILLPLCSPNRGCRLTQPQPFTWGTGIQTQALMLSKHTLHPQSHLQSLILFSMESLNSRTSVVVQTAISHYSLSYFGYTITTGFSGSPSLSVSPSPSLRPPPRIALQMSVTPGDAPYQEPHQLRTPISFSKPPSFLPKPLDTTFLRRSPTCCFARGPLSYTSSPPCLVSVRLPSLTNLIIPGYGNS